MKTLDQSIIGITKDAPPVVANTSILQSASSFFEKSAGLSDPRAKDSFRLIAQSYCNNSKLFLPLPKDHRGHSPLFLKIWRKYSAVEEKYDLELTDEAFDKIGKLIAKEVAIFIEGWPFEIIGWVEYQFTEDIVGQYLSRTDERAILRAAGLANELIQIGLPKFESALLCYQKERQFREPGDYSRIIGKEIKTLLHLCVSYILSVCLRGWSYGINASSLEENPEYQHIWLRAPAFWADVDNDFKIKSEKKKEVGFIPWGAILIDIFKYENQLSNTRLIDVLDGLRERTPKLRSDFLIYQSEIYSDKLTDFEIAILDALHEVKVSPPYRDTVKTEKLAKWLRALAESGPTGTKSIIEIITCNLQNRWLRNIEYKIRRKFRRNTIFDVFDVKTIKKQLRE